MTREPVADLAQPRVPTEGWTPTQRVVWLERFYDLVFVACVGRFANELGSSTGATSTLSTLAWLTGLWLSWFLVVTRLNRFPDERWVTRGALVFQLLAVTMATGAAVSSTTRDDTWQVVAVAGMAFGVALLYVTIPRVPGRDGRLVVAQVVGNSAVAATVLLTLVLPTSIGRAVSAAAAIAWFAVVLLWYLPRVAHARPVEPRHAGERYGQLFLVLMGLSFLKVAFEPDQHGAVLPAAVLGAFAVGFSLWSIYVDGVLPLGFPTAVAPQQRWLVSQLLLAIGITAAAAAVVAVSPSAAGNVTLRQAVLEGASIAAVFAALASIAHHSARPRGDRVVVRLLGATAVLALACVAGLGGGMADTTFSLALAAIIVLTSVADQWRRVRHA